MPSAVVSVGKSSILNQGFRAALRRAAIPWTVMGAMTSAVGASTLGCSGDATPAVSGSSGGATAAGGGNGKSTSGGASQATGSGGTAQSGGAGTAVSGGATALGNGGVTAAGGVSNIGGATSTASGGAASGGATSQGGAASGGAAMGGTSSGGATGKGGTSSGGSATGGAATGGATGVGGSAHTGVWKVMPLGDSITASTCYPQLISKNLIAAGHTNFQFVGTQTNNQSCGATTVLTEGHGGYGVTFLPQNNGRTCSKTACGSYAELLTWAAEKPDMVLMHYGTNDVWDGQPTATILSAYLAVISEFRKQNANVIFFVSKIIKLNPSGCSGCLGNVANLAAALTDSWATTNSTATSPIFIVDNYASTFDPNLTSDAADGVHPTPAGAAKTALVTSNAVSAKNYF